MAVGVDPNNTLVSEVMTPNPTSVRTDDGAMEALGVMLERHFKHLPVSFPSPLCSVKMAWQLQHLSSLAIISDVGGAAHGAVFVVVLATIL